MTILENIDIDTLLHSLPSYAYWLDSHNIFLGCNKNQARLMGLKSPHEIIGKSISDFQDTIAANKMIRINEKLMKEDKILFVAEPILRKRCNTDALYQKVPIKDKNNQVVGLLNISYANFDNIEVNENHQIKANDEDSRAHITSVFFKNITESLPQYLFWKDKNSVYLGCNKNYAKLFGFNSPEDIIGKTDYDLNWQSSGDTAEKFQKGDKETLSGKPIINQEEVLVLPNGKTLTTIVSKLPILDKGNPIGIVGYFTDITERKKMEEEVKLAKEKAEAASQAKSVLISNMGHDLKTPFIGIEGNAKILCDNYDEQEPFLRELWDNMLGGIIEIKKIISEIIEATATENPSVKIEPFSINQILEEVKALLLATAQSKKIDLIVNKLDSNESDIIETDKLRFKLILNNFASNALKFTVEGSITFTVLRKGYYFHIKISDTGIGIPKDQINNVFELFTKLSPSNIHNTFQGTGSGLTSAKTKAEELGAIIEVESEPGRGSTFTLIIPIHPK